MEMQSKKSVINDFMTFYNQSKFPLLAGLIKLKLLKLKAKFYQKKTLPQK